MLKKLNNMFRVVIYRIKDSKQDSQITKTDQ